MNDGTERVVESEYRKQLERAAANIEKYILVGLPAKAIQDQVHSYIALAEKAAESGGDQFARSARIRANHFLSLLTNRGQALQGVEKEPDVNEYGEAPEPQLFQSRAYTYNLDEVYSAEDPRLFFLKPYFDRIRLMSPRAFGGMKGDGSLRDEILALSSDDLAYLEAGYEVYKELTNETPHTYADDSGVQRVISTYGTAEEMYAWSHCAIWPDIVTVLRMYGKKLEE